MADEKENKDKIALPAGPEPEASPTAVAPWWEKGPPNMVTLTIDGKPIQYEQGASLFNAVKENGVFLPAMCYHYSFSPFGSCGVCLVEVEGKSNNVRACTAKVTPNMVVRTDTEKIKDARKKAIEKHLLVHPLDCPVCDADGKCELQDLTYELGVYNIAEPKRKEIPEDTRSLVLDFNMNRCILCGQCINVCKEVQMIDALCFYKKDKQTHVGAHGGVPLYCEFCGDCLAVCPVGAIVSRYSKYAFKPWQLKKTETTCTYCSDGCQLTIESEQQKVTRVTSTLSYRSKFGVGAEPGEGHGGLCVRGRFGFEVFQSPKRLSRPLMQKGGRLVEVPWFEALKHAAQRLGEIKTAHGPEAVAGLITGRCTNEEVYLFQKMMRLCLGTNHIDSSARYGLMNGVLAMQKALGIGRSMVDFNQIAQANLTLIIGSDITETHPVESLRIKDGLRRKTAKSVVVDPIQTKMAKLASLHLQNRPGSERWVVTGLIKAIIDLGKVDPAFAQAHPAALEALQAAVARLSGEEITRRTGLEPKSLQEVAEMLLQAPRAVILFGEGVLSREAGYAQVLGVIDLAMVSGLLWKEGSGLHPVSEESNEQGTVDMGGVPEYLPGQALWTDPEARARFTGLWREELPTMEGHRLHEILARARRGEIRALYIVGENPLATLPASAGVDEALRAVEFIICQDPFLTETAERAHLVFPAAMAAEKEGTYTNVEGKICRLDTAFDPRGESRPDWKIFSDLSRRMGQPLLYKGPEEIRQEITQAVEGYFRPEPPRIDPVALEAYLRNGYAEAVRTRYSPDVAAPASEPNLQLGQIIYHSGKLTTRDEGLMKIYGRGRLKIGPADAERLRIVAGQSVKLHAEGTEATVEVEISDQLPPGLFFFPEHFNQEGVKELMRCQVDPDSGVLSFKVGSVRMEALEPPPAAPNVPQPTGDDHGQTENTPG